MLLKELHGKDISCITEKELKDTLRRIKRKRNRAKQKKIYTNVATRLCVFGVMVAIALTVKYIQLFFTTYNCATLSIVSGTLYVEIIRFDKHTLCLEDEEFPIQNVDPWEGPLQHAPTRLLEEIYRSNVEDQELQLQQLRIGGVTVMLCVEAFLKKERKVPGYDFIDSDICRAGNSAQGIVVCYGTRNVVGKDDIPISSYYPDKYIEEWLTIDVHPSSAPDIVANLTNDIVVVSKMESSTGLKVSSTSPTFSADNPYTHKYRVAYAYGCPIEVLWSSTFGENIKRWDAEKALVSNNLLFSSWRYDKPIENYLQEVFGNSDEFQLKLFHVQGVYIKDWDEHWWQSKKLEMNSRTNNNPNLADVLQDEWNNTVDGFGVALVKKLRSG